ACGGTGIHNRFKPDYFEGSNPSRPMIEYASVVQWIGHSATNRAI
ncbi:hypothetical protein LCGC14_2938910, partial [marine sediment metagenome]